MRTPSFVLALLTLAACGGGGSSSGPVPEPAPPVDTAPVAEIRVIDADTVDVDGVRWRLHGIDAPEARQSCRAWGPDLGLRCGRDGRTALGGLRA